LYAGGRGVTSSFECAQNSRGNAQVGEMHNVLSNRNRAGVAWPGDVAVSSLIQRLSVIGTNLCKRRTAVQSKETLRGRSLEYRSGTMKHHAGMLADSC
jgi:hypothetical protein